MIAALIFVNSILVSYALWCVRENSRKLQVDVRTIMSEHRSQIGFRLDRLETACNATLTTQEAQAMKDDLIARGAKAYSQVVGILGELQEVFNEVEDEVSQCPDNRKE